MTTKNDMDNFYEKVRRSLEEIDDPGKLSELSRIEVDLVKEQLRALYDRLSDLGNSIAVVRPVKEKGEKAVEVEFEIPKDDSLSPSAVEEKIQQSETETAEIESEEILSVKTGADVPKKTPAGKRGQPDLFNTGDGDGNPGNKSVADTIKRGDAKESVADKLVKQAKVNSLKSSIGINEKFFFINELFEGNLNEYNAAIEALDKMGSIGESAGYLEELAARYKWDDHGEAAVQLKEFIDRKFS